MSTEDRRVHARWGSIELVRYDKAGKWYVEIPENYGRHGLPAERLHVTLEEAAERALNWSERKGVIYTGVPGGQAFDRLVQA